MKDIAERAASKGSFSYSRFFAVGLFRLLELANATEPTILEKVRLASPMHQHYNSMIGVQPNVKITAFCAWLS